jgi:protein SCO1/2
MSDISRRTLLGWIAKVPMAGAAAAVVGTAGKAHAGAESPGGAPGGLTLTARARRRVQEQHFPNIPLVTHEGKEVLFYDDLVKDKVVTLNFFYAKCDGICPTVSTNLARVQRILGAEVGKRVFMYSFTLKPEEDTVDDIRRYREMHHVKPGWTFLTGKPEDLEKLRKGIGFTYPNPAIDKDKSQHIGNVRYGNEPLMLWAACPGMANPEFVAESVSWMLRPEQSRIQPS